MRGQLPDSAVCLGEIAGVAIWVVAGDIADLDVDVVVNAANDRGWMGSGVAGAIRRRGGPSIQAEAIAAAPGCPGTAWATSAGSLAARHVVHAAAMGQDLVTDAHLIDSATRAAIARVRELDAACVALPALGTGVGGFDLEDAAVVMTKAVAAELGEDPGSVADIVFALHDPESARRFGAVVSDELSSTGQR